MQKLKDLRKERKKTQQEVASDLGINRSTFNGYEQGISEPDLKTVIRIADYFGCSVDYLLGHQTTNILQLELLTGPQRELFELLKTLDEKEAYSVIGYIGHMRGQPLGDIIDKILNNKKE